MRIKLSLLAVLALGACSTQTPTSQPPADVKPATPNLQNEFRSMRPVEFAPILSTDALPIFANNKKRTIGTRRLEAGRMQYSLFAGRFGVEQWEQGKRGQLRQVWDLNCSETSPPGRHKPYCSLDRLQIVTIADYLVVDEFQHDTSQGNLVVTNADWEGGLIQFSLTFTNQTTIETAIRFSWSGDLMQLDGFSAGGVGRSPFSGEVFAVEYRIPEFTYALAVPIVMEGLRSAAEGDWNRLLGTFTDADQKAIQELLNKPPVVPDENHFERIGRSVIADYEAVNAGRRKLTADEERQLTKAINAEARKNIEHWLNRGSVSEAARRAVLDFIDRRVNPA